MLIDCMFSQLYESLIESQNCCLDSNPNSVIGSTGNQFKTPVRVDISTRHFPLSFISVVNLLMTFSYFFPIDFFISVLSFFRLSSIVSYAVSSDVILPKFLNSISAVSRNIRMNNSPYLVGREISTPSLSFHMCHPVTALG